MDTWKIVWRVRELVKGPPHDECDFPDGTNHVIVEGAVEKSGNKTMLRAELTNLLERSYPKLAMNATQNLERSYEIEFLPVVPAEEVELL